MAICRRMAGGRGVSPDTTWELMMKDEGCVWLGEAGKIRDSERRPDNKRYAAQLVAGSERAQRKHSPFSKCALAAAVIG